MAGTVSNQTFFADSAERSLDLLLAPYLTPGSERPVRLPETDVRQISAALGRMGKASWSKVPRIYTILRMIDHVQIIDSFLNEGVSDFWFPFSHKTLPESLRSPSARFEFLQLQDVVLTKALDLEREDGRHRHFSKSEDIPLQKMEELGKGGYGRVDRVVSTITYKEYARKLIPRGKTFKKNIEILRDFERELSHLKKMSHLHIVELIGSYTDPKFVGILMFPVADYNLKDFLARESLPPGELSFLRTFYGCLAAALCYLHENRIRHKDIKPANVLVRGHQVFLTDFGISLDWSELDQSTTTGLTVKTPRYCAPEVADHRPRNSLSDLWSLGCVFLEIWTLLKGETVDALFEYLSHQGSKYTSYHLNCDSSLEWCTSLEGRARNTDENPPLSWIRGMLQLDQEKRWTAQMLVDRIQEVNDCPDYRYAFSGVCCISENDSTDSDHLSNRSSTALQETGASSVGVYEPRAKSAQDEADAEVSNSGLSSSLTIRPSKALESDQNLSKEIVKKVVGTSEVSTSTSTLSEMKTDESPLAPQSGISTSDTNLSDGSKFLVRRKPVSAHTSPATNEQRAASSNQSHYAVPGPVPVPSRSHQTDQSKDVASPETTSYPTAENTVRPSSPAKEESPGLDSTEKRSKLYPLGLIPVNPSHAEEPGSDTAASLDMSRGQLDGETISPIPGAPEQFSVTNREGGAGDVEETVENESFLDATSLPIASTSVQPYAEDLVARNESHNAGLLKGLETPYPPTSTGENFHVVNESRAPQAEKTGFFSRLKSRFSKDREYLTRPTNPSLRDGVSNSVEDFVTSAISPPPEKPTESPPILTFSRTPEPQEWATAEAILTGEASRSRTQSSEPRKKEKTCGKCQEIVKGQFVRALDDIFHLDCFTCAVCCLSPYT